MGKTKKKKKILLSEFTKCNPASTRSKLKGKQTCLPPSVYATVSKQVKTTGVKSAYEAVGCKEGEDHCFLDKAPIEDEKKKELRKQYLRPRRPKSWKEDPDQWLDNYNIMAVMKQYEEAIPWFQFMGVFPIDFSAPNPYQQGGSPQCLHKEICTLDLKKEYAKGVRGIGMVFNLDPHFKSGSHWVSLYIDLKSIKKPFVGYFDSYGYKTPSLIARLMRTFKLQVHTCKLGFNARRFQFGDSECGMFSLYFLICMIRGIPFQDFCKDSVDDGFMLELRNILFAN
jgi:hypothetical protein